MTPGALVLGLSLVAGVAAVALGLAGPRGARAATLAHRIHAAAALGALALLAVAFLASDLSYRYVWDHTDAGYPLPYRLAGLWGGEEGTVLLWGASVALLSLLVARRAGPLHARSALLLAGFSTILAAFALAFGTFDATPADLLAREPTGRGLAEVLLTPLMVIHPPLQFVAYALVAVPAAYALAALTPGAGEGWTQAAFPWARRAWLLATLGLGLGALWAYYVLSFGGYWAWDPVETSNLMPWLALTAFLHAGKHHVRFQDHALSTPLFALGAWLLTLFATFATRSGLWVSVHAFTDPTDRFEPDAAARLLAIVDAHPPTRAFLALLTAALFAGFALLLLHHERRLARPASRYARGHALLLLALAGSAALDPATTWALLLELGARLGGLPLGLGLVLGALLGVPPTLVYLAREEGQAKAALSPRALMTAAVALLAVSLAVVFLVNLQVVNGPERRVFDQRAPFLALPLVSVLTVTLALGPLGKRGALALAAAGALLGAAAWWLFPGARVFALSAPLLAAATVAAALKLAHVQGTAASPRLRAAGILLLAASVLGMLMWSNPPTYVLGRSVPHGASVALGFAGFALCALGLVGSVASFRERGFPLAAGGAAAAALAMGYGVGGLLALAALGLVLGERARFRAGSGFLRHEGARLRETGIYLIHLALVLGLLGYAASTYSQERATFASTPLGATVEVADYTLRLDAAATHRDAAGRVESVAIPVRVEEDGATAGATSLDFRWSSEGATYAGRLEVRRTLAEDVYLTPLAFHTSEGWVGANSAAGARLASADVDAVTFSVSVLPLMSLVWGGLWIMLLGMALVLAGSAAADRTVRVPVQGRAEEIPAAR